MRLKKGVIRPFVQFGVAVRYLSVSVTILITMIVMGTAKLSEAYLTWAVGRRHDRRCDDD